MVRGTPSMCVDAFLLLHEMAPSAMQAYASSLHLHAATEAERRVLSPYFLYLAVGQEMMGSRYWFFTVNELGQMDIGAQLDYIDRQKREELLPDKTRLQQEGAKPSRKRAHRPSLR